MRSVDPFDHKKWKSVAIRALARREHGRAELTHKLIARGADAALAKTIVREVEESGFLSDARYAESVVNAKAGNYAKKIIAYKLKEVGVDDEAARAALDLLSCRDEKEEATALWQKKFGVPPVDEKSRNRHVRFLLSRGYPLGVVLAIVPRAGNEA